MRQWPFRSAQLATNGRGFLLNYFLYETEPFDLIQTTPVNPGSIRQMIGIVSVYPD